jgi:methanogenic corrinoid protein MtbC1
MARDSKEPLLSGVDERRVDALARRVISALRNKPPKQLRIRIAEATDWLVETALSSQIFILDDVRVELMSRNLAPADIMDHCIADAAREMGRRWSDDEASFASVSLGSARLHGLCKLFASNWDSTAILKPNASVLIAVCDQEHHLIGPVVLADQVRRSGYSVHLMVQAVPDKVVSKLTSEPFATVFISCSSTVALDNVRCTVQSIRAKIARVPRLVLGGPLVDHFDDLQQMTAVDLVTNNIGLALANLETQLGARMKAK